MSTSVSVSDVRIVGHRHAPDSAARQPATLIVHRQDRDASFTIETPDGERLHHGQVPPSISDRVGSIERQLTFADGSVFTTADNDAVDTAFRGLHRGGALHALESSYRWIALAVVGTAAFSIFFVMVGLPFLSERIAHALPQRSGEIIAASTLEFLDDWVLEPSTLDPQRQSDIEAHVGSRLLPSDARNDGIDYQLHFRDWTMGETPIPNALALPSGDIVLTDEFVRLTESQEEMDSVILHEIGHIVERHSLQRIVQATFVGVTIMMVTGDGSGLADMGVGLGSLLLDSRYSRHHETDADRYAFERMLELGIDPRNFATIMARLEASMSGNPPDSPSDGSDEPTVLDYLSSHPGSADRIEQAQRYGECFDRGLIRCEVR